MRVKPEILNLINDNDTRILIDRNNGRNKWYLVNNTQASKTIIAYGQFSTGKGTIRESEKELQVIVNKKRNNGFWIISQSEFIQSAGIYEMFSRQEYDLHTLAFPKRKRTRQNTTDTDQTEINPIISIEARNRFIKRLNDS